MRCTGGWWADGVQWSSGNRQEDTPGGLHRVCSLTHTLTLTPEKHGRRRERWWEKGEKKYTGGNYQPCHIIMINFKPWYILFCLSGSRGGEGGWSLSQLSWMSYKMSPPVSFYYDMSPRNQTCFCTAHVYSDSLKSSEESSSWNMASSIFLSPRACSHPSSYTWFNKSCSELMWSK